MRLLLTLRTLRPGSRPCQVVRDGDLTLVAIHLGAPRADAVAWCVMNLTREEQNALRAGLGQPPVGQPLDDWMLQGRVHNFVPASLRLEQEPGPVSRAMGA